MSNARGSNATQLSFDEACSELIEAQIRSAPPELQAMLRITQRHFNERLAGTDPLDAESIIARCMSGLPFDAPR